MTDKELKRLLRKYKKDQCSDEDLQALDNFYMGLKNDDKPLPASVISNWDRFADLELDILDRKLHSKKKNKTFLYVGAAAVILFAIGVLFLWQNQNNQISTRSLASILPGKSGAMLLSSSGKTIDLEKLDNKTIKIDALGNVRLHNGFLQYMVDKNIVANKGSNNKIFTPLARQFKLELSDGTKVWLNSGSSIEFPTVFDSKIRKIVIHGEAYLEVKHMDRVPFVVNVNDHFNIEDIGTSFNISAYEEDKKEIVTLVEGKIRIGNNILAPMDQLIRNADGKLENNKLEDASEEIIWTKGFLNFNGMNYPTLLKKISRWYNVEIKVDGNLPNQHISGNIPNNMPLSNLLKILENYGLHFNYNNNILTVSEKKTSK